MSTFPAYTNKSCTVLFIFFIVRNFPLNGIIKKYFLVWFFCFSATNTTLLNRFRISDHCQMSPAVFNVAEVGKGWKCCAIFIATDETVQCYQAVSLVTESLMCYLNPHCGDMKHSGLSHWHAFLWSCLKVDAAKKITVWLVTSHLSVSVCLIFMGSALCPLFSGTSNGSVLVYNLTSGLLHKELSVHSCEVR